MNQEKTDVRESILDAATTLFAERGFDGTSLRDVAEEVGIRKPSLLYHFPSKEELRRAVLDKLLAHWSEVLPRVLLAASSGKDRFHRVLVEVVGFFDEDPDRARLIVREALDRPAAMRELLESEVGRWVDVVAEYVETGRADGRIHADVDPHAYVVGVIQLVIGMMATREATAVLVGEDGESRLGQELFRFAESALFRSRAATAAPRGR